MHALHPVRNRRRAVSALISMALLAVGAGGRPASARGVVEGKPAVATTTLTAAPEDVYAALLEALSTWPLRKKSLKDGIVKTEWVNREKGNELYRGRVVAEFQPDGYQTHLTVRHEKQRKMTDLHPTVQGPSAEWRDWDGDQRLAQAVVSSVEDGVGQAARPRPATPEPARPAQPVVQERERLFAPDVESRLSELKSRRRDLVKEVKVMDQRILDAVYGGHYEEIKGDIDPLRERKAAMERQITDIDKEILALVLAE